MVIPYVVAAAGSIIGGEGARDAAKNDEKRLKMARQGAAAKAAVDSLNASREYRASLGQLDSTFTARNVAAGGSESFLAMRQRQRRLQVEDESNRRLAAHTEQGRLDSEGNNAAAAGRYARWTGWLNAGSFAMQGAASGRTYGTGKTKKEGA
jgi:hypothetical protein